MRRWFLFLFGICSIALYAFRLYAWPTEDQYLKQVAYQYKDKNLVWYFEVIEEPDIQTFAIDIVGCIEMYCLSENQSCQKINKSDIYKTKIHISKSKFSTTASANLSMEDVYVGDVLKISGKLRLLSDSSTETKKVEGVYQSATATALQKRIEINNRKNNIFSTIQIDKVLQIESRKEFHFKRFLISVRKYIESTIARFIPNPESDLAAGLVVSGKDSLSKEILEEFKRVGLIHIVVLSGSNVSIISQALFNALAFTPFLVRTVLGIFFMTCFAIMTGASPPVVRSVFMSSIPLLLKPFANRNTKKADQVTPHISDRIEKNKISIFENNATLSVLLFVVLIMSIINPLYPIHDISFQLSFLATFGLIVLSGPISKRLTFIPQYFGIREIVASSLATQVYIGPLLLHMSGGLSIVFLIANIVVLPLLPILMFFIFLLPFTSFILPILADVIGKVSYLLLHFVMQFTHWLSTFSLAVVEYEGLSGAATAVIYFFLFMVTLLFLSFPQRCE